MPETALPADVHDFLAGRIRSYEALETLVLILANRDTTWTALSVATKLNLAIAQVHAVLDDLCKVNLLDVRLGGASLVFRYQPGNPELGQVVERFAQCYSDNRIEVMKAMGAIAAGNTAIKSFADAFILRKKPNG